MSHLCGKVQLVSCYHRHELANLIICTQLEFMYLLFLSFAFQGILNGCSQGLLMENSLPF